MLTCTCFFFGEHWSWENWHTLIRLKQIGKLVRGWPSNKTLKCNGGGLVSGLDQWHRRRRKCLLLYKDFFLWCNLEWRTTPKIVMGMLLLMAYCLHTHTYIQMNKPEIATFFSGRHDIINEAHNNVAIMWPLYNQ